MVELLEIVFLAAAGYTVYDGYLVYTGQPPLFPNDMLYKFLQQYIGDVTPGCTKTCTPPQTLNAATCTCVNPNAPGLNYVYESKFGSKGSGPGQFQDPHDVSFDKAGNAFIPDRVRNDVQVFTHAGKFVRKFGGPGSANGRFNVPYSTAHDASDNFYVSDRENNRIQKLSHDGTYITKITSAGGKNLNKPEDLAFDFVDNTFYVCDTGNNRILKFDKNHTLLRQWGRKGSGNGEFDHPHSIDVGTDRNVYVSCGYQPYIQKFTPNGQFIKKWGSEGSGPGQVRLFLEHMDIDIYGRLHLINNDSLPIINVYSQEGQFLTAYGNRKKGGANGQFSEPEHVTCDSAGKPWVVDSGNFRIQIFRPTGSSSYTKTNYAYSAAWKPPVTLA